MALLRHSEDSIFFKDMDGRFSLVSEAKARRSGVGWEQMIGTTDFDYLPIEEAQKCRDDEIFVMETGQSLVDKEEELTRLDGTKSWISVSKFPWKDFDGETIGVIGISRDITKRKQLEKNILRMLSIATHDMRSPIASIALTIKFLAKGSFGEVSLSVKQTLIDVFNRMMRLEKIVGKYLTESSVLNSSTIGRKEKLDLRADIIDPILGEFSQEIGRGAIQIDNRLGGIPGDKIFVSANKTWLGIVYRNLFSNAIRYTPQGGVIAYGFEDKGNVYRLNVFNNGHQFPQRRKRLSLKCLRAKGVQESDSLLFVSWCVAMEGICGVKTHPVDIPILFLLFRRNEKYWEAFLLSIFSNRCWKGSFFRGISNTHSHS